MTRLKTRPSPRRPSKYRAEKVIFYGEEFASKAEGLRYLVLLDLVEQGVIYNLRRQPRFPLDPAFTAADGERFAALHYTLDYIYQVRSDPPNVWHVEEVKGYATKDYKIRLRLFKRLYPQYIVHIVSSRHYT